MSDRSRRRPTNLRTVAPRQQVAESSDRSPVVFGPSMTAEEALWAPSTWAYSTEDQQAADNVRMREAIDRHATRENPYLQAAHEEIREGAHPLRERVAGNDLQHLDIGDGGIHAHILDMSATDGGVTANGPRVSLHAGQIEERESTSDEVQYGFSGHASLASVQFGDAEGGGSLNTPHADFEASVGQRGVVLEAGASALDIEGHTPLGFAGDARVGAAVGPQGRAGVRTLVRDVDGDGCDDYGVRVSAGPVVVEATTEGWCEPSDRGLNAPSPSTE